ncbi:hypothetical protein DAA51_16015 [Bradyrhizobium sp. WBAH10]|nr:hypothetical protein [Bradyrhizobium sp. WBAH30]MDD1540395.1 hypothetical protein [Bradyrhizobium sp. WBAH41]MDD1556160.1 hypothetical protein [Bradyrhizobium sp. WBAH23]MDD1563029.1 hypothetical protein [Bradyrhizobium sp. WBAH33]MDD1588468.1 hypothetical protein [Bradyrhizobium sp. WBAH42]NRB86088.1 hypothetical protein [Bradyrhizobium sp. WBAH10]QCJ89861.1 hypothetical protein DAA57_16205 [Bradyrhizobium yuanmingense]
MALPGLQDTTFCRHNVLALVQVHDRRDMDEPAKRLVATGEATFRHEGVALPPLAPAPAIM